MGYTPEMLELIKKVEASRPERIARSKKGMDFEPLSLAGRQEVLDKFHPDYKKAGRRAVSVGPSKGEVYPTEFVDVLESKARLQVDNAELEKLTAFETDVLVIGGGGAGTSASLLAQENGSKVILATKLRHGDANTVMAEGGIQGASQEVDSPYYHYLDVIGGGHFTNTPELVAALTHDAPLVIEWLESLGLMFDKQPDGRMRVRHGGGTCRKRMHSSGDITGSAIMRVLKDEARNRAEDITILEFSSAIEILKDAKGRAAGALFFNMETEEYFVVKAKATIIATGGYGRLHIQGFATTNHYGATADGLVMGTGNSLGRLDIRLAEVISMDLIHVAVHRKDAEGPILIFRPRVEYLMQIQKPASEELERFSRQAAAAEEIALFKIERVVPAGLKK